MKRSGMTEKGTSFSGDSLTVCVTSCHFLILRYTSRFHHRDIRHSPHRFTTMDLERIWNNLTDPNVRYSFAIGKRVSWRGTFFRCCVAFLQKNGGCAAGVRRHSPRLFLSLTYVTGSVNASLDLFSNLSFRRKPESR